MTSDPRTIDADATVGEALDVMLIAGFRHLPVTESGTLAGIVSMTDLVQATTKRASE
jgi:CBS domain-containing protein